MAKMVHVQRDESGKIVAVGPLSDGQDEESLPENAPEVADFLRDLMGSQAVLSESDRDFVRVLDDLIEVLIQKDVIKFTDLPEAAQSKVLQRQSLRGLALLSEEEDEII